MSLQFYRLDPPLESCLLEFTCQKFQLCVKTLGADTSIVIFTDKSVTTAIMRRKNVEPRGWGGGGTQDFKWQGWLSGAKNQTPPKSLGFQSLHKVSYATIQKETWLWNNQKNPYLIKLPKKILAKISYATNNPKIQNFKPQIFFYHPCHLKSGGLPEV